MDTISFNPEELDGIAKAFFNFDKATQTAKTNLTQYVSDLRGSWEGPDANEAFGLLTEIEAALDKIGEITEKDNKVLSAKAQGFGGIKF